MTVQIQLAEKYLSLVWNDNRNDVDVGNKLAIINLLKGNFNNSVSILRDCIKNSPDNSAIYNTLGIAYVFSKLNKKAIQAFKSSLNLSPSYTPALLNLVERMIRDGQIKEALDITESFCEKFDDSSAREVLAKLYLFSGSYHRCLIVLRQIYSRLIESNSPYGEQARVMNNIGVVYHKMGDLVNAELFYLESLKMSDDDPKIVLSNLIDIYFFTEKLESALKYINRFKQKYPNDKIHLYYQARYSALKNSFVDSIEYLKDFLGHEKRFAEAYGLLSYIYSEIESNYAEAINILDSAMLQLPDNILIINNLAYNYLMINNINKAREILQKVENIDDDIFLTATRGLLALKENNLDYGRYLYNKAIGMSKDLSLKTDIEQKKNIEIAKYFLKQGSRSQAIDLLKKVSISKNTIFTRQAQNLLNSLENIN